MKQTKLHELIAVEPELKKAAQSEMNRIKEMFTKGSAMFTGYRKTYRPATEEGERFQPEQQILSARVMFDLGLLFAPYVEWIDVAVQKESANTKAFAQVVLDDKPITPELPVGALLNLESKLVELKQVLELTPTLDPTEIWKVDGQREQGVYVSEAKETYRTVKINKFVTVAEATDKHPAQVAPVTVDERAGVWTLVKESGMLAVADKNAMLGRLNTLIRAVKSARERANSIEVDTSLKVGKTLTDYILGW